MILNKVKVPKIGWILLGDKNVGSSRTHGINIHNFLLEKGVKSIILQSNSTMKSYLTIAFWRQLLLISLGYDIFIFQKVHNDKAIRFAKLAKKRGIKTIFIQSDLIDTEIIKIVDYLIVTSDYLKQYYDHNYGTNAIVIEDAIEVDRNLVKKHSDKNRIEIVWVGYKDNWKNLDIIHKALKKLNDKSFYLKKISNHPEADIQWNLETVYKEILTGDIAIIPCSTNEWGKAKSNNRLTMFMALGLPVIVSPIPSYKKIIRNGYNGFLAENINDWVKYFLLSKDITIRRNIGMKAKEDVLKRYSIEVIGDRWLSLINRILGLKSNIQYC